jgi:hypothetical protein
VWLDRFNRFLSCKPDRPCFPLSYPQGFCLLLLLLAKLAKDSVMRNSAKQSLPKRLRRYGRRQGCINRAASASAVMPTVFARAVPPSRTHLGAIAKTGKAAGRKEESRATIRETTARVQTQLPTTDRFDSFSVSLPKIQMIRFRWVTAQENNRTQPPSSCKNPAAKSACKTGGRFSGMSSAMRPGP